jgi:3-phosphoshikimate 1-carboxyvinyltransferase
MAPLSRTPDFSWTVPGSKSITNRALVLAALSDGASKLTGVLDSDDTRHMKRALRQMGIGIQDVDPTTLIVDGGVNRLRTPDGPVFVGNSGTTVRFLTALSCLVPGPVTLQGDEHMQARPISDLVEGLEQLGARIDCVSGCPPVTVHSAKLSGGRVSMRGDRSSQYFSALLMTTAAARLDVELEVQGELVSRPYVELTLQMIGAFSGSALSSELGFRVERGTLRAAEYHIEPDASSASYAFAAAIATGGSVRVPGLGTGSAQGDYAFTEVLERLGASVRRRATETTVTAGGHHGVVVDMHHISDTVMTLAALAPLATGTTRISNVANIRIKETDRLAATVTELERLGQRVSFGNDWLAIEPRALKPATVECYSDHRMAMSFAILGLAKSGIKISDPTCVSKTYPDFWNDLGKLYRSVGDEPPFTLAAK